MKRPATLVVTATVLVGGLAACGGPGAAPSTLGAEYVALGDSYTAAPGISTADDRSGCYRSDDNYPHLVARATGMELADRSCSNADTTAIESVQTTITHRTVLAQSGPLGPGTKVVTIGIGANDFGLISLVKGTCPTMHRHDPTAPSPCTDAADSGAVSVHQLLDQMGQRLDGVLRQVHGDAPDAQVLVIGYPTILPTDSVCDLLPIAPGDLAFARSIVDGLNRMESKAAKATGSTYVDTTRATRGHDICAAHPWIAGAKLLPGKQGAPWHPYAEEQAAVAKLVEARLH
ncbi:SGNH/GDSL hydrolase family protein [Nocardioides montaniterrae]